MVIRYASGRTVEALLLSQTEGKLRILARGSEDSEEIRPVHGTWVGEACEPVQVEFGWKQRQQPITEPDCACSKELAAYLIRLLHTGSDEAGIAPVLHGSSAAIDQQLPAAIRC